jgi:hypothetical protein
VSHPQTTTADPAIASNTSVHAPVSVRTLWLIVAALVASVWVVSELELYTPGSDFGYNLGLAGGIMMLLLLLYPLRKHVRFLNVLGKLKHWFSLHMVLGIAGPILILFHSMLQVGSLNGAMAFYSMLIVAGSGIIGRFIYTKIHHGLYGRQATLQERQVFLGLASGEMKSAFHFAPTVEQRLKDFEAYATSPARGFLHGTARFLSLVFRGHWVYWRSLHELRKALAERGISRGWDQDKLQRRRRQGRRLLHTYLDVVQDVAQFHAYERMFSAWHILHVPLVFMLVISGIVHVIAVHMY